MWAAPSMQSPALTGGSPGLRGQAQRTQLWELEQVASPEAKCAGVKLFPGVGCCGGHFLPLRASSRWWAWPGAMGVSRGCGRGLCSVIDFAEKQGRGQEFLSASAFRGDRRCDTPGGPPPAANWTHRPGKEVLGRDPSFAKAAPATSAAAWMPSEAGRSKAAERSGTTAAGPFFFRRGVMTQQATASWH